MQAGVPKGVVSVLPGKGSIVGDALVKHPLVQARSSFTGGTATGKHIAHIAADKLMPVSLELGGKSPTIVFEDADLDHAVNGVLFGIFSSSGESCIAGSRLFVAREHLRRIHGAPDRRRRSAACRRSGGRKDPDGPADHHASTAQTIERYVSSGWRKAAAARRRRAAQGRAV